MEYIIANIILIVIALIGVFIIKKNEEGLFMGINDLFITIYLLIIGAISIIVNVILIVINIIR